MMALKCCRFDLTLVQLLFHATFYDDVGTPAHTLVWEVCKKLSWDDHLVLSVL